MKKAAALIFSVLLICLIAACAPSAPHIEYPTLDASYTGELTVKANDSRYKVKVELTGAGGVKKLTFEEPGEMRAYAYIKDGTDVKMTVGDLTLDAKEGGSAQLLFALFELSDGDISGVSYGKADGEKRVTFTFSDGSRAVLRASDGTPVILENDGVLFEITG